MEVCLWYKEMVFYNKETGEGFQSRSAAPAPHLPANPGERGGFGIITACPFATEISSNNSGHWCQHLRHQFQGRTKVRTGRGGREVDENGWGSIHFPPPSVSLGRLSSPRVACLRLDERKRFAWWNVSTQKWSTRGSGVPLTLCHGAHPSPLLSFQSGTQTKTWLWTLMGVAYRVADTPGNTSLGFPGAKYPKRKPKKCDNIYHSKQNYWNRWTKPFKYPFFLFILLGKKAVGNIK